MKELKNLKKIKTLSKEEQKAINGGGFIICNPRNCCSACYRGFCMQCPPRHQF